MDKPTLLVIAGCNGSSKSSFSKAFTKNGTPFDYDKIHLQKYNSLIPNDLRDQIHRPVHYKILKMRICTLHLCVIFLLLLGYCEYKSVFLFFFS